MTSATSADWRTAQRSAGKKLKSLLIEAEVTQVDVAEDLGIHESAMSAFMNARRQWPEDFEQRVREAVKARAS